MKKLLTTAFCLSLLTMGMQTAKAHDFEAGKFPPGPPRAERYNKPQKPNLDELLNLTDKQKAQAKANRIAGRKEMKPIMDEIRAKKEAIWDIKDSDLSEAQQKEKIKVLQEDIKNLSIKANEIREKNMANFEKILTKDQKAKFDKIRQDRNPHGCPTCKRRQPLPIPEEG